MPEETVITKSSLRNFIETFILNRKVEKMKRMEWGKGHDDVDERVSDILSLAGRFRLDISELRGTYCLTDEEERDVERVRKVNGVVT